MHFKCDTEGVRVKNHGWCTLLWKERSSWAHCIVGYCMPQYVSVTHCKTFGHSDAFRWISVTNWQAVFSLQPIAAAQRTNLNAWTTAVSRRDGCVMAPTTVAATRMSPTAPARVSFTLEPCPTWTAPYMRPAIRNNLTNRPHHWETRCSL